MKEAKEAKEVKKMRKAQRIQEKERNIREENIHMRMKKKVIVIHIVMNKVKEETDIIKEITTKGIRNTIIEIKVITKLIIGKNNTSITKITEEMIEEGVIINTTMITGRIIKETTITKMTEDTTIKKIEDTSKEIKEVTIRKRIMK
jgi:hypothetical protein